MGKEVEQTNVGSKSFSTLCFALILLAGLFASPAFAGDLTVELRAREEADAPVAEAVKLYGASHALVIGNDLYTGSWPRLSNAVKDAKLIAAALEARGFKVTLKTNLKSAQLVEAFETFFYETGQDAEARLFLWYAGHGYSERGEGYLVPVDAPDPSEVGPFLRKALSLRRMGEYVRGASALHILSVFDSCFAGTVFNVGRAKPPAGITRATTRPVRQFLTSGDAGQEVSDDGTFRKLFIRAINGEVRADANRDGYLAASELGLFMTSEITNYSNGGQTPRNGKLNDPELDQGDFIFRVSARPFESPERKTPRAREGGFPGARSAELLFWDSIKSSNSAADFEDYLAQFPSGTFAGLAQRRIASLKNPAPKRNLPPKPSGEAEVVFWNSIQDSQNAADFQDYRKRFPNGIFSNLAKRRIKELENNRPQTLVAFGKNIAGIYEGKIAINKTIGPVKTNLYLDAQGRLAGEYIYNRKTRGTLSEARRTGSHGVTFTWREKVGAGELSITFAPDYKTFAGKWTYAGNPNGESWTGRR